MNVLLHVYELALVKAASKAGEVEDAALTGGALASGAAAGHVIAKTVGEKAVTTAAMMANKVRPGLGSTHMVGATKALGIAAPVVGAIGGAVALHAARRRAVAKSSEE